MQKTFQSLYAQAVQSLTRLADNSNDAYQSWVRLTILDLQHVNMRTNYPELGMTTIRIRDGPHPPEIVKRFIAAAMRHDNIYATYNQLRTNEAYICVYDGLDSYMKATDKN